MLWIFLSVSLYPPLTARAQEDQKWETTGTFVLHASTGRRRAYCHLDYSYHTGVKDSSFWAEVSVDVNSSCGVYMSPGDPIFAPREFLLIQPGETWNQTYVQTITLEGGDYQSWPFEIVLELVNYSILQYNASGQYHLLLLNPGTTVPAPGFWDRYAHSELFGGLLVLVSMGIWNRQRKYKRL